MKSKVCEITAGASLARTLNRRIDAMESDDRSRADIIDDMAEAAGIDPGTVNQILSGDINCPPIGRLEGFAGVLDVSVGTLTGAAESDGCSYDEDADNTGTSSIGNRIRSWYEIRNMEGGTIQISIHDEIGLWGISAADFIAELRSHQSAVSINLSVHSPGGSVLDGFAMYNALKAHPAKVYGHVEGIAASAASFVLMASDSISMPEDAFIMIHNARGGAIGDADDLRGMADILDKVQNTIINIYEKRTGQARAALAEMMKIETWMNAADALSKGFIDTITDRVDVAAKVAGFDRYFKSMPIKSVIDSRSSSSNRASAQSKKETSMSTSKKSGGDPVYAQADLDAAIANAKAEGKEQGFEEGRTAERDRVAGILGHAKAASNFEQANNAVKTGLSLEQAQGVLDAMPGVTAKQTKPGAAFAAMMEGTNPDVAADAAHEDGDSDDAVAARIVSLVQPIKQTGGR